VRDLDLACQDPTDSLKLGSVCLCLSRNRALVEAVVRAAGST